jgi:hypothetical protein
MDDFEARFMSPRRTQAQSTAGLDCQDAGAAESGCHSTAAGACCRRRFALGGGGARRRSRDAPEEGGGLRRRRDAPEKGGGGLRRRRFLRRPLHTSSGILTTWHISSYDNSICRHMTSQTRHMTCYLI